MTTSGALTRAPSPLPVIAAIEAGGTKFNVVVGPSWQSPLASQRFATTTPNQTIAAVTRFLDSCEQSFGTIAAVGVAAFGPVVLNRSRPDWGTIGKTTKPGWSGVDLISPLTANGRRIATIDTDVNAAAIAEARWGAGAGHVDLAYITVGTGLGVGLVIDGLPRHGLLHPEAGHIPLRRAPNDLFPGICPFHGDCAEGLLSGPAITKRLGRPLTLNSSDADVDLFADYLGQLCATLVLTTSIATIVIGGGVMEQLPLHHRIEAKMRCWLGGYIDVSPATGGFVVPPDLGSSSGIAGAFAIAHGALTI